MAKESRKGISPLIAAVLLIAFTMAVAGLFAQWAPQLTEDAMGDTSDQASQIQGCAQSRVNVESAVQRGDNEVSTTFEVQGDQELDEFTLTFMSQGRGNVVQEQLDNQNLSNSEIRTVSIETPDRGLRYSQVEVASEECPNSDTANVNLQCPGGFAGIDEYGGYCIMKYEASHSDATDSSAGSSSVAASQQAVVPWTNIDYPSARNACQAMGEGYNLSTNKQWQAATEAVIGQPSTFVHGNNDYGSAWEDSSESGTPDSTKNGRVLTGTGPESWVTSKGVYDLNGNVWEWVYVESGDAEGTVDQSHPMHFGGTNNYVNEWNHTGEYPSDLSSSANSSFGGDHYWSGSNDNMAVRRGGDWNNGRKAGPFSMLLNRGPSASRADFGFRCSY